MTKSKDTSSNRPESGPLGSRTSKPHASDGWQLGGRKEDSTFNPELAQDRANRNK